MRTQASTPEKDFASASWREAELQATIQEALARLQDIDRGKRIRKLRIAAGFSSAQKAAAAVPVSYRTFQYWEAGHEIDPDNLKRLAKVLKTRPEVIDPPEDMDVAAPGTQSEHATPQGEVTLSQEQFTQLRNDLNAVRQSIEKLAEALTPPAAAGDEDLPSPQVPSPSDSEQSEPGNLREGSGPAAGRHG